MVDLNQPGNCLNLVLSATKFMSNANIQCQCRFGVCPLCREAESKRLEIGVVDDYGKFRVEKASVQFTRNTGMNLFWCMV